MKLRLYIAWSSGLILLLWLAVVGAGAEMPRLDAQRLDALEREHGVAARARVEAWYALIDAGHDLAEADKLTRVNDFFNTLRFRDDRAHWQREDYWATPLESLSTNGGDCEDFSIAKYITLREMGIAEDRLRLTYVKAVRLNQAHMVVTYFASPNADPLVLDNLVGEIRPASQRNDLYPVYSFNGDGLWLAKQRDSGRRVGTSQRLSLWRDMLERMGRERRP